MNIDDNHAEVLQTYRGSALHNAFLYLLKSCKQMTVTSLSDVNLSDDKAKILRGKLVAFNELENYFGYLSNPTHNDNVASIKKTDHK